MKRALTSQTEGTETTKKLKAASALDNVLHTIQTANFDAQDLALLIKTLQGQYSAKLNSLTQHFPQELWGKIIHCLGLSVPLPTLLTYRTVSKSWVRPMLSFSKLWIPENTSVRMFNTLHLFSNLRSLWIDVNLFLSPKFDVNIVTQLRKLVLLSWEDKTHDQVKWNTTTETSYEPEKWKKLETLTNLEVLSAYEHIHFYELHPLTNLKKLTVCANEPYEPDGPLLAPLTNLEYLYLVRSVGVYTENFTSVKTLISDRDDFYFQESSGYLCYQDQDPGCGLYEGDWQDNTRTGIGKEFWPIWRDANSNPSYSPYQLQDPIYRRRFLDKPNKNYDVAFIQYGDQRILEKEVKRKNWILSYDGGWQSNVKHGPGTYFFRDGSKWHGEWDDGIVVKPGIYESPQGTQTKGVFQDFKSAYPATSGDWEDESFQYTFWENGPR